MAESSEWGRPKRPWGPFAAPSSSTDQPIEDDQSAEDVQSSAAASSPTASAARITCVFCGIEHNEYTAPGIPALTCHRKKCIDLHTYKRQKQIANVALDSFAWSSTGDQPDWAIRECNEKQWALFDDHRYVHRLRTFASMRGRMVCDICNHTFPPSDSAFLYPELIKDIDKFITPFVCYDCGCMSDFL
jgi:hypothetical protein